MRGTRILILVGVMAAGYAGPALGLTAVVEVNESSWYRGNKDTRFGGASVTRFLAPLPVFFEGWKSEPRAEIADYVWDFGDGSPLFRGFNGAHVYQEPGKYTATLTVVDEAGDTATASVEIEVLPRAGKTYYVDSATGNDANAGTSPEAPWRTATKALAGIHYTWYGPGDSVLFRRGQVFDLEAGTVNPGAFRAGYGYIVGAYGEGAKPIIRHVGTATLPLVRFTNPGAAHIAFMDLHFEGTSPEGAVSDIFNVTNDSMNLLFLRCHFEGGYQSITLNGKSTSYVISNAFIVGCTFYNAKNLHLFGKAHRYALLNCHIDYSDNHLAYLSYINRGVISGNLFTRPPHGRTALRISGSEGLLQPTNNVYVGNNTLRGWVDPLTGGTHTGGGTRYTAVLVEYGPNTTTDQGMEYGIFEDNVVEDAETLMKFGNWEHLWVRRNVFRSASNYSGPSRLHLGHSFERRPLKNVRIVDNTIVSNEKRSGSAAIFALYRYNGSEYQGTLLHQDIHFRNNRVTMDQGVTRLVFVTNYAGQLEHLHSDGNVAYASSGSGLFQIGGTWNSPGEVLDLSAWRARCGNDRASLWLTSANTPLPGVAMAPPASESCPITVEYSRAACGNGSGLKAVRLWVRKEDGPWTQSGLASVDPQGTFQYAGMDGDGRYHFSLQAENNSGFLSPEPTDYGHTTTVYACADTGDSTPPGPVALTAPATASSSPWSIAYQGAADNEGGSGLKAVYLWARKDGGPWTDTGLALATPAGTFAYAAGADGLYEFATCVEDLAGNRSPHPTGAGSASTILDTLPPTAGTLTAPATTDRTPIALDYSGSQDVLSGLKAVYLWVKKGTAGTWARTDLVSEAGTGAFAFADTWGNDVYYFSLQAEDRAGNVSAVPTGSGMAATDFQAVFASGRATSPALATRSPISVSYSGAADSNAGLRAVHLWSRKGAGGAWSRTGLSASSPSGTFSYVGMTGDDTYYFAVQAENALGETTPAPSGGGDTGTLYDTTAPTAGAVSVPAMTNKAPLSVTYTGANDSGSGLQSVELWVRKEGRTWAGTGLTLAAESGAFAYTPSLGSGTYHFAVVARDKGDLTSPAPSGNGQATALYDVDPPAAGTLSAPEKADRKPILLAYQGASDSVSGIASVRLWAKKGAGGTWAPTGLVSDQASGTFQFSGITGNDTYYFGLQAEDRAGNRSEPPTGYGAAQTLYEAGLVDGAASSPAYATAAPIVVSYSGAAGTEGDPLDRVHLWVKKGEDGAWSPSGLVAEGTSGTFSFSALSGDGLYHFAVQAENVSGAKTPAPIGAGDTQTVYDTTAPAAGSTMADAITRTAPLTVDYAGASDAGSGLDSVELWVRRDDGAWAATGLVAVEGAGRFVYAPPASGRYRFAVVARDRAGLTSPLPADDGPAVTLYDGEAPVAGTLTVPAQTDRIPVTVGYSGATDALSGLKSVTLWARKGDAGPWAPTEHVAVAESGQFDYHDIRVSETVHFALVAEDQAGNRSPLPSGDGGASTRYARVFTAGTAASPAYATASPIAVRYSGASDSSGALAAVRLWFRCGDAGPWTDSGLRASGSSGTFDFVPPGGDGPYRFALQAEDSDGARTNPPSGEGDSRTVFDTQPPNPGTLQAVKAVNKQPFIVTYKGVTDDTSGIKAVMLWIKDGRNGIWVDTGLRSTAAPDGTFEVTGLNRDGKYYFYLQAEDKAGLKSPAPTDESVFVK